ncbi:MAG: MBL fold metallo-hydrolase RNA specificity domain-containing protein, partial [Candidatus Acidiferrales bacterium]
AHIQESDVAYVNKRRGRQGKKLFEPLYTLADAEAILERFRSLPYDQTFEPVTGVRAQFIDAGHILGSAVVVLDIEEKGRRLRLAFSGDLGRSHHPLLRDPQVPEKVDYVLMESTYGDRRHEPLEESTATFHALVRETFEKRGKLLIPAFALGRTQELVYALDQFDQQGTLPPLDVYVDSPLAVNVTEVFRRHAECFNAEARAASAREPDRDPLAFPRLRYVQSVEESKRLNELQAPAIILSASGMCESGRILHHLKNNVGDPNATVLFVGFQAQHTLGHKLLEGMNPVPILGDSYPVKACIKQIGGYSAHADRAGLLAWAAEVQRKGQIKRVFLVHGEEKAARALADGLRQQGVPQVDIPTRGQVFEL